MGRPYHAAMPVGPALCLLLIVATLGLSGCLGSAFGVLTSPATVAAGAASGVGNRAFAGSINPISDIDRILAANPEAANRGELGALRDSLAADGGSTARAPTPTTAKEFDRHAQIPKPLRGDQVALETTAATGTTHGPAQRMEAKPFASARTSSLTPDVRRWYDIPITPVRLDQPTDSRRISREGERGGR